MAKGSVAEHLKVGLIDGGTVCVELDQKQLLLDEWENCERMNYRVLVKLKSIFGGHVHISTKDIVYVAEWSEETQRAYEDHSKRVKRIEKEFDEPDWS